MPGVIAAIQTFGDRIILRQHLHFLVTEGGVDEARIFHKIPRMDDSRPFPVLDIDHQSDLTFLWAREYCHGAQRGSISSVRKKQTYIT